MTTHEMVTESLVRAEEARKASLVLSSQHYGEMAAWHERQADKTADAERDKHLAEVEKHNVAAERLRDLSRER